jgi:predicted hydrocarbon binding protein
MLRQELGDFSSITCFKSAIVGMEEALGEKATAIALTAAGRSRGKNLAKELGIAGVEIPFDVLADKVGFALGKDGTRLCKIDKITEESGTIRVYTSETLCSAGEPQGSNRKCTFTMGAVWGVVESVMGKRYQGKQVESVLQGASHDVFEFTVL